MKRSIHEADLRRIQPRRNCATAKTITAPFRISTISIGTLLNSWMFAPAEDERAEKDGCDRHSERRIAGEQRDRDAREAVAGRKPGDEAVDEAERMDAAREPAGDARSDHHAHENVRQIDADRTAESRIEPDQARTKAGDGETAPEAVSDDQDRLMRKPRFKVPPSTRRGNSAAATIWGVAELAEPRASNGPSTSQLVRSIAMKFSISVVTTSSTPSRARRSPGADQPSAADNGCCRESDRNEQSARPGRKAVADDGRNNAAEIEAAFCADIEYAGAKGDRRSEPVSNRGVASVRVAAIRCSPPKASSIISR